MARINTDKQSVAQVTVARFVCISYPGERGGIATRGSGAPALEMYSRSGYSYPRARKRRGSEERATAARWRPHPSYGVLARVDRAGTPDVTPLFAAERSAVGCTGEAHTTTHPRSRNGASRGVYLSPPGIGVLLSTQEMADLDRLGSGFRDQVLGIAGTTIAHRQSVPVSAEFIARMVGTHTVWKYTHARPRGALADRSVHRRLPPAHERRQQTRG